MGFFTKALPSCLVGARRLFIASLTVSLFLIDIAWADCPKPEDVYLLPGQTKTVSGDVSIRLDRAEYNQELPDIYYISVKLNKSGTVLSTKQKLLQYESVTFDTLCGLTVGASERQSTGKAVLFSISYF